MANVGKLFEGEIKRFLETRYKLAIRLPDILVQVRDKKVTTKKPFDFCGCDSVGRFVAVECKATRGDSFSFNRIEEHQVEALGQVANTKHGKAFLALNFREEKQPGHAWLIPWNWWVDFEKSPWKKKSIRRKEAIKQFDKFALRRVTGGWRKNLSIFDKSLQWKGF